MCNRHQSIVTAMRRKVPHYLCLVALTTVPALASPAQSTDLGSGMAQATDTGAMHHFLANPAGGPSGSAVGAGMIRRTNESARTQRNSGTTEDFKVTDDSAGVGFSSGNPGFTLGLGLEQVQRVVEARLRGTALSDPVETFRGLQTTLRGMIGITEQARLGLLIRHKTLEANIAGSYFTGDDDRTNYSGSMVGFGAGAIIGKPEASLGAGYVSALKGKAKVEGEDKVIADPGLMLLEGAFSISPAWRLGLGIKQYLYIKDDRRDPATSPINQSSISLDGVDQERELFRTTDVTLGCDFQVAASSVLRASVVQGESEFVFDAEDLPGKGDNASNRFQHQSAKVAFQVGAPDMASFQIGLAQGSRKKSWSDLGGGPRSYKATDRSVFAVVAAGF